MARFARGEGSGEERDSDLDAAAYTRHLGSVGERREVVAGEAIYNAQGALVLGAGEPLTAQTAERIVRFKLLKPLEDSVTVRGEIDARLLYQHLNSTLVQEPELYELQRGRLSPARLRGLCQAYERFPLLRQKITVLSLQLPDYYRRSLFSVWLCLLMAERLRLSDSVQTELFLAALAHDIGMLHIDTGVISARNRLDPSVWRQLQAHTVIGQRILAAMPEMPAGVARAVLEHHERCDGTGYPFGRVESELSALGQLVGLADTVMAIYLGRYKRAGRNLRDLVPFLQINARAYFHSNYQVLMALLRSDVFAEQTTVHSRDMPHYIDQMLVHNQQLRRWYSILEQTLLPLGFVHGDRTLHAMQNVFFHIAMAINGSGVLDEGYQRWLRQVQAETLVYAYREVETAQLLLDEVEYHLRRLTRMMALYQSDPQAQARIAQALQQGLTRLKQVELQEPEGAIAGGDYAGPLFAINNPTEVISID